MSTLDVAFNIQSQTPIPVDHAYFLYGAISRELPTVHTENGIAVHPLRGRQIGQRLMTLQPWSRLVLRLQANDIPHVLKLAGKKLRIGGDAAITVGVPEVHPLVPATILRSRITTIKGFFEPEPFREAVRRQLDSLEISPEVQIEIGKRRTLRIKEREIIGFETILSNLNADESLKILEQGLGGRRHMGCGVFVAVREVE